MDVPNTHQTLLLEADLLSKLNDTYTDDFLYQLVICKFPAGKIMLAPPIFAPSIAISTAANLSEASPCL